MHWSYNGLIFGAFERRLDGLIFGIRGVQKEMHSFKKKKTLCNVLSVHKISLCALAT